jgi:hypothetical protein
MKRRITRRQTKNRRRTRRKQRGGFGYVIPPDAIVVHRDMDDSGTNPPRLMTKRNMDASISDSERA